MRTALPLIFHRKGVGVVDLSGQLPQPTALIPQPREFIPGYEVSGDGLCLTSLSEEEEVHRRKRHCHAVAEAAGLTLLPAESNLTGYHGVKLDRKCKSKPYVAKVKRGGKTVYLGHFATAEEAALAFARAKRAAPPRAPPALRAPLPRAAAETAETAAEARRQAEAEGVTLLRSESSASGFQGVNISGGSKVNPYQAQVWRGGKYVYLGLFPTAEEAALAYARSLKGRAAAAAAVAAPAPLTAPPAFAACWGSAAA